ncbi:hypothetical protein Trihar35433_6205 [Trichoderma harzianum]|nr:hypothetical protein Trihar35433_6205 [Trichoderma harzianum]
MRGDPVQFILSPPHSLIRALRPRVRVAKSTIILNITKIVIITRLDTQGQYDGEANLDFDAASVSGPCGPTSFAGVEGEKRKDGLDSEEEAKSLTSNDSLEPQDIPNQAEAGQGPEAEPPGSAMDSPSHWQHNPLQRQEKALEKDSPGHLSDFAQSPGIPDPLAPTVPTSGFFGMVSR